MRDMRIVTNHHIKQFVFILYNNFADSFFFHSTLYLLVSFVRLFVHSFAFGLLFVATLFVFWYSFFHSFVRLVLLFFGFVLLLLVIINFSVYCQRDSTYSAIIYARFRFCANNNSVRCLLCITEHNDVRTQFEWPVIMHPNEISMLTDTQLNECLEFLFSMFGIC